MKKLSLVAFVLGFAFQALAVDPIVKTGTIWMDQPYTIEMTYLPLLPEPKLLNHKTTYYPEEQDCNYLRPAFCSTSLEFFLGTVQVRIFQNETELTNPDQPLLIDLQGSSFVERAPIEGNLCNLDLLSEATYKVFPSSSKNSSIKFQYGNTAFDLTLETNSIQIPMNGEFIVHPVSFNPTNIGGWARYNDQSKKYQTELHTTEEWAKIQEENKNRPTIDYLDRY